MSHNDVSYISPWKEFRLHTVHRGALGTNEALFSNYLASRRQEPSHFIRESTSWRSSFNNSLNYLYWCFLWISLRTLSQKKKETSTHFFYFCSSLVYVEEQTFCRVNAGRSVTYVYGLQLYTYCLYSNTSQIIQNFAMSPTFSSEYICERFYKDYA